ncbi:MAG TPA: hypothetical protein DIT99_23825, partial [Candidatus Latescibacteria bacterium]|nr:hypothetical protein [Candidatus Latescibacterota bacterium]
MKLDWDRLPASPSTLSDDAHPFDTDLGITGSMSLLRLLDTSISQGGSTRLSRWLLNPLIDPDQIRARQTVVQELMP